MGLSVRVRFEVFKRDDFTCQYCGVRSPEVILEVDHIHPVSDGGTDEPINLITSCWSCNRGKGAVPLDRVMTGEDPHDKAIEMLERERQIEEYNAVVAEERDRRERETWTLVRHWKFEQGYRKAEDLSETTNADYRWLLNALKWCPREVIKDFMDYAIQRHMTKNMRYVAACARNWRYAHAASQDVNKRGPDEY